WRGGRRTWLGVGLALASAAAFAMCDVLVMAKAKSFGVANYLAVVMGVQLLLSFTLLPLFRQPLRAIPKTAWPWLLVAGAGMGVQAILMNIALGHYGNATAFNIIYSTRGLWSVLLIWVGGSLVGNIELRAAPGLIVRRMAGALLLLGAVALLLI
ncbi:MAG: EamA/RhaT family transporter, partial [Opitutales bacterium]